MDSLNNNYEYQNFMQKIKKLFLTVFFGYATPLVAFLVSLLLSIILNDSIGESYELKESIPYLLLMVMWLSLIMIKKEFDVKNEALEVLLTEKSWEIRNGIAPLTRKGGVFAKFLSADMWDDILKDFTISKDNEVIHAAQMYSWSKKLHNDNCYAYYLKYEAGYINQLTEHNAIIQSTYYIDTSHQKLINKYLKENILLENYIANCKNEKNRGNYDKEASEAEILKKYAQLLKTSNELNSPFTKKLSELKSTDITVDDAIKLQLLNFCMSINRAHVNYIRDFGSNSLVTKEKGYKEFEFKNVAVQKKFGKIKPQIVKMKRTAILNTILSNRIVSYINNTKGEKSGRLYIFVPIFHPSLVKNTIIQLTIPEREKDNILEGSLNDYAINLGTRLQLFVDKRLNS